MAVDTPPAFLQAGSYSASRDRLHLISARHLPTALNTTDIAARSGILGGQSGRQANFSMTNWDVTVGRFIAVIENTFASQPGDYQVFNLASQVLSVTPASTTTNRIDIIGVRVQDAFYSGALNQADLVVVQGTPAAGTPADPALPASFMPIVRVTVNANTSTGILTGMRKRTATMGSLYVPYTEQLSDIGTMSGEAQYLPAAGVYPPRVRVWDGTAWRGVASYQFDKPAQVGSGTLTTGGNGVTIMSVSVADPGYAYKLQVGGSIDWAVIAGSTPNQLMGASITLDSTVYNVGEIIRGFAMSSSIGAGFNQPTVTAASSPTGTLTGAHTIRLMARNFGGSSYTIPPASPATTLSVELIPA